MMATSPLLESNYTHTHTLLQVLTKVSPQIEPFIQGNFANYLRTHFLASNFFNLQNVADKSEGVVDIESQKKMIEKFHKESHDLALDSFSYLPLFNLLVGSKFSKFINQKGTIFYVDSTGGLFLVDGSPFHYKSLQKEHVYKMFSIKDSVVHENFKKFIETIQGDNHVEKLIFDELKLVNKKKENIVIQRTNLLYSRRSRGKMTFSKISSCKDDESSFKKLLEDISKPGELKVNEIKNVKLKKWFQTIRNNFSQWRLDNLFKTHCPLPSVYSQKELGLEILLKMNTTFKNLFKFIYAVYNSIFPVKTFGSARNQRKFFENLKVLFTASLAVKFRLFDILNGIDVEEMRPLFDDLPFYTPKANIEARFLLWIFERITDAVKSKFYITEGDHDNKFSLLFYRYDLWMRIRVQGMKQLMVKNGWCTLIKDFSNGRDQCMSMSDYLKYSELRLIPKKSCLRPILSLKFHHDESKNEYKNIQRIVLQLLKRATKGPVFDSQGGSAHKIYERIIQLKNGDKSAGDGGLYVIRGDFENCYPSMNLTKLLKLILQISPSTVSPDEERNLLIELFEIYCKKGNFYKHRRDFVIKPPLSDFKMSKSQSLLTSSDFSRLKKLISKQLSINSFEKHVFSSIKNKCIDLNSLIDIFGAYLSKNAQFRFGKKRVYKIKKGLRQGTSLASDICEIYLSNFFHHIFNDLLHIEPVTDLNHFFLRVADDFIFVTRDLQMAKDFSTIVCKKSFAEEWGLKINTSKFTTNFNFETGELDNDLKISFFGRKILTRDLSVSLDFDSFKSSRIADTFNCNPFAPLLSIMKANISK